MTQLSLLEDLEGFAAKDVSVEITREHLIVNATRVSRQENHSHGITVRETTETFHRRLDLPAGTQPEQAEAHLTHGLLSVIVPITHTARTGEESVLVPVRRTSDTHSHQ